MAIFTLIARANRSERYEIFNGPSNRNKGTTKFVSFPYYLINILYLRKESDDVYEEVLEEVLVDGAQVQTQAHSLKPNESTASSLGSKASVNASSEVTIKPLDMRLGFVNRNESFSLETMIGKLISIITKEYIYYEKASLAQSLVPLLISYQQKLAKTTLRIPAFKDKHKISYLFPFSPVFYIYFSQPPNAHSQQLMHHLLSTQSPSSSILPSFSKPFISPSPFRAFSANIEANQADGSKDKKHLVFELFTLLVDIFENEQVKLSSRRMQFGC